MIKSKRIISVLLSVILTVSCIMPVIALAAQDIYYTVSFRDENGNALGSEYQVSKGSTIDADKIPALPKSAVEGHEDYIDDGNNKHSTYSWDSDPATTVIVNNTVFTRIRTTESHDYDFGKPQFTIKPDSKSGLAAVYTCSKCGSVGEIGLKINGYTGKGISVSLDGSAIGGESAQLEHTLTFSDLQTAVSLAEKLGVPATITTPIKTILNVADKVEDVANEIAERVNTCAKEGHLYGEPTFSWSEDHSECYAHFTCTRGDCYDTYDNHVVDKKMLVQGPYYTYANCTEDGIETYNATTKFTDTNLGKVSGYEEDPEHDFTTSYSSVWQQRKGHKYTQPASNNDATCTENGTTTMVCENCGDRITNTDANSALGHSPGAEIKENVVNATCTQNGSYQSVRYCIRCGIEMSRENKVIPATGHTEPADYVVENKTLASCTNGGSFDRVKYCTVCGDEVKREHIQIAASDHTPGEPVKENATESTCTNGGSYELVSYCTVCGIEIPGSRTVVNVPKGDHDFENITTPATCTAQGKVERTCKVCGFHYTAQYLEQLEHDYEETEVPPTCIANGYTIYTCSLCGDTYTDDETPQTDHHWNNGEVTVEPGCETVGVKTFTCKDCTTQRTEEIVPKEHKYSTDVIQPTCTKVGYTVTTCDNCGETEYTNEVPAKGHTGAPAVRENEHPATCTEEGSFDSVIYCEDCGEELKRTPCIIPKKVHNSDRDTISPTCTEQGYTVYTCKDCHVQFRASFRDPKGHHEVDDPAVPSTCVTHGKTAGSHCPDCGFVYVEQEELPLSDHTWNNGVITTQPTTTETGVKTFSCIYCTAKRYETLPTISIEEATPSNDEANRAKVNKVIKKPADITTISHFNYGKMDIYFSKVPGAQNYRVMYRKAGAKNWNYAWTKGQTHFTLTNLKKNGLYEFMFAAYKKNANGEWERGDYSQTSYRYYRKANIKKVKAGKKSASVKWTRDKAAIGYELFYATNPEMTNRKKIYIKGNKKTSATIKGLKKGKKYYIRVRSIKKSGGKNYTSEFSKQKIVKAK